MLLYSHIGLHKVWMRPENVIYYLLNVLIHKKNMILWTIKYTTTTNILIIIIQIIIIIWCNFNLIIFSCVRQNVINEITKQQNKNNK